MQAAGREARPATASSQLHLIGTTQTAYPLGQVGIFQHTLAGNTPSQVIACSRLGSWCKQCQARGPAGAAPNNKVAGNLATPHTPITRSAGRHTFHAPEPPQHSRWKLQASGGRDFYTLHPGLVGAAGRIQISAAACWQPKGSSIRLAASLIASHTLTPLTLSHPQGSSIQTANVGMNTHKPRHIAITR